MSKLPEIGTYVSTKKVQGIRLYVENAFGDDPNVFFIVEVIDEASKNDFTAMGNEMDKKQWEALVEEYGLEYQR
ncbi:MAG: hypothetical protein AB2602_10365 [Candidatus Thiodiazotropha sp.]